MSTPRSLEVPGCATATTIGRLAALVATPDQQTRAPVVLVPGYTGSKEDFLPALEPLSDAGHRVVAYDQRGQYESTGDEDPLSYEMEVLAGDLLDLLERIGGGPAHVVGHSFGGLVTRRAALRQPAAFRSLTLLDSGPSAIPGSRAEHITLLRPVLVDGGKESVWELSAADHLPPDVAEFLRRRFFAGSEAALLAMGDALMAERDLTTELAATGLPLLVAYGENDDAWPPETQADMAHRLSARHEVISNAAHSPFVEQPEATTRVLLDFWASVEDDAREAQAGTA